MYNQNNQNMQSNALRAPPTGRPGTPISEADLKILQTTGLPPGAPMNAQQPPTGLPPGAPMNAQQPPTGLPSSANLGGPLSKADLEILKMLIKEMER